MRMSDVGAPSSASPLWIIALFIALAEAMASVASITTSGAARIIFAVFAVTFPLIVFGVFVWLLVAHTAKLYAPTQYSEVIGPERFNAGVNAAGFTEAQTRLIGEAVARTVVEVRSNGDGTKIADAARAFEKGMSATAVTVDLSAFGTTADSHSSLVLPTRGVTVDGLLDQVWYGMERKVPPFTYGSTWLLIDEQTEEQLRDIGTAWAKQNGRTRDNRPPSVVGILPGSRLTAVLLPRDKQPVPIKAKQRRR